MIRRASEGTGQLPVAVGEDGRFQGVLAFRGAARIEGTLEGRVEARGTLWIGPNARVDATIDVDELVVEGEVEGVLRVRERAELLPTARVRADLDVPRVALAEGCRIEGRCRSGSAADRCADLS